MQLSFCPTLHLPKLPLCYWLTVLPDVFGWPQYPYATVNASQVSNLKHLPQISSAFCVSSLAKIIKGTHLHNLSLLQGFECLIRHWRYSLRHLLSPCLGKVKLGFTEPKTFQRKTLMCPHLEIKCSSPKSSLETQLTLLILLRVLRILAIVGNFLFTVISKSLREKYCFPTWCGKSSTWPNWFSPCFNI